MEEPFSFLYFPSMNVHPNLYKKFMDLGNEIVENVLFMRIKGETFIYLFILSLFLNTFSNIAYSTKIFIKYSKLLDSICDKY